MLVVVSGKEAPGLVLEGFGWGLPSEAGQAGDMRPLPPIGAIGAGTGESPFQPALRGLSTPLLAKLPSVSPHHHPQL